jgi:spermidine/putrescine transport system permease protein
VTAGRGESVREPRGLILPAWGYYAVFFIAPLLVIAAFAFAQRSGFFDYSFGLYTDNFERLWHPAFLKIYTNTLWLSLQGTIACLLVGYPFAYWLATRVREHKTLLMLLVIVPFWTSILIRTYAWVLILAPSGFLSGFLRDLHLIGQPLDLLGTDWAILVGIVYDYLPLMVFPLYVSIDRMDRRLVEASRDLGVGRWGTFWRVTVPLTLPGIMTGCLLVFVPMTGEYVVPTILGGGLKGLFAPVAADTFLESLNYGFGAAMSLVLVVFLLVVIYLYLRVLGRQAERNLGAAL